MKTRDIDIRTSLHALLTTRFKHDPDTLIVDELGICQGEARIDIAVVNCALHGYEIKSEKDTLERLPKQVDFYSKVFDSITIVTGDCHLDNVTNLIPEWWGIKEVTHASGEISLSTVREPSTNPQIDPYALVQLLWRNEALDLLRKLNLAKGYLSKPRSVIWKRLSQDVPLSDLQHYVRQTLKCRRNWRVVR